jgi:hypothetical protein
MSDSIGEWLAKQMEEFTPVIDGSRFPPAEHQQATYLSGSFDLLTSFIEFFENDLELFDHAEADKNITMQWAPIACRDAALNLWGFRDALSRVQGAYRRCPRLQTEERERALESATADFSSAFPDAKDMRDITAHPVPHLAAKGRKNPAINGWLLVHNSWTGRKVMNSHEGREISFELSAETILTLRAIRKIVFSAFR